MRLTLRTPQRDDTARRRRRGRHRARSFRDAVPGLVGLGVLISLGAIVVTLSVLRPGSVTGDPAAAARPSLAAGRAAPVTAADRHACIASVTALLRGDLVDMSAGRPDAGASSQQLVERQYPAGSSMPRRISAAHDTLLGTAARDLFGRYARDIRAEVTAYGPRIAAACG